MSAVRKPKVETLTDIIVETHQRARDLALVLHDNPYRRADTPVHELEGEDRACHRVRVRGLLMQKLCFWSMIDLDVMFAKSRNQTRIWKPCENGAYLAWRRSLPQLAHSPPVPI